MENYINFVLTMIDLFYVVTENANYNAQMPFRTGRYHVTVSTDGVTRECAGDPSSTMTVSNSDLVVNSCKNTNTYRKFLDRIL